MRLCADDNTTVLGVEPLSLVRVEVGKIKLMKIIPFLNNLILLLGHIAIIAYVNTRQTFGESGYRLLLFYHNYASYFILFIVLNTAFVLVLGVPKKILRATLFLGVLSLLLYIGSYNNFNPY